MLSANMYEYVDVVSFNQHIGWLSDIKDATKMTWKKPYYTPVIVIESFGRAKYGLDGEKSQRWTESFRKNTTLTPLHARQDRRSSKNFPIDNQDFSSHRRVHPSIQNYNNRKSLLSDDGEKKSSRSSTKRSKVATIHNRFLLYTESRDFLI